MQIIDTDEKMGNICRDCKALDYSPDANSEEIAQQRRAYHSQLLQKINISWKDPERIVRKLEEGCELMESYDKPL